MRSRTERLILCAAFALALGAAIAHEYQLPYYCLRLVTTHNTSR
jgi:hypothetical protein